MNTNPRWLPHDVWHYSGEFLRQAIIYAGDRHLCDAMMEQADALRQEYGFHIIPFGDLIDKLSDGLFYELNETYEVAPLGMYSRADAMEENLHETYGAAVALDIICDGQMVSSRWRASDKGGRGSSRAVAVVLCEGSYYPMLIVGSRRKP